jgi:hypothetical protein
MNKIEYNKETEAFVRSAMERIQIQDKLRNAILDMMSKVSIDEAHNYTRLSDGKWLAGVTSVSGIVPKDWLSAWGAKEAVKFLGFSDFEGDTEMAEEMLAKIRECKTIEEYLAILKEAKGASARKKKEALLDGTAGHDWCEQYIKSQIRFEKAPEYPDDKLKRALEQFVKWAEENVDYWILSEARVCDVEREYAGTLDAVAKMKDGSLALVDLKFASHISPEYALQTAGYTATFEKYGILFDKRIIVRLPKTLEMPEWDKVKKKYKMVENTIEVKEVDTPYEFDRDAFYHALPLKKWINFVENKKNE